LAYQEAEAARLKAMMAAEAQRQDREFWEKYAAEPGHSIKGGIMSGAAPRCHFSQQFPAFAIMTWNSDAGVAKLMPAPCFLRMRLEHGV
jgi:hypothetical protein